VDAVRDPGILAGRLESVNRGAAGGGVVFLQFFEEILFITGLSYQRFINDESPGGELLQEYANEMCVMLFGHFYGFFQGAFGKAKTVKGRDDLFHNNAVLHQIKNISGRNAMTLLKCGSEYGHPDNDQGSR
jgi:hypothetical protein